MIKEFKNWLESPKLDKDYHKSTGYLSNSFLGDFESCEYGAIYKRVNPGEDEFNEAFATGHLVEAYLFGCAEDCLERYKNDAYLKTNGVKAWVKNSVELSNYAMNQESVMKLLRDENSIYHQVVTYEFAGFQFKSEIDCLNLQKRYEIDVKTTSSDFVSRSWNEAQKVKDFTFIDEYNYHRQRALYRFGIKAEFGEDVTSFIFAISKKNKMSYLFEFDDSERFEHELHQVSLLCDKLKAILNEETEPSRCNNCDICAKTHRIKGVIKTSSYCGRWR